MTKSKLLDLADRVEALEGPDREVDALIASIVRLERVPHWARNWAGEWRGTEHGSVVLMEANGSPGPHFMAREYTTSLDSAMSLVPEGYALGFKRAPCQRSHAMLATIGYEVNASGATPALALTAACLRARAQAEEA